MLSPHDLFSLSRYTHAAVFDGCKFAWEALSGIEKYILDLFAHGLEASINAEIGHEVTIDGLVFVGQQTVIEAGALIRGPAIIGEQCEIRHGAYIRGNVLVGNGCVIGHATEVKNSILLNGAQAGHFAYVGDSILGNGVNLGAGTKLANLPISSGKDPDSGERPTIWLQVNGKQFDTGRTKLGAILGDGVKLGCNTVTNPGCIVGQRTLVYALVSLRKGYYPADRIIKLRQDTQLEPRRTE
jgi:NDP-sugar pyrophosphorylase family protein